MAFHARGLYLTKDLQPPDHKDFANNAGHASVAGDRRTRCLRPGCSRYVWLSQADEHLAFHDESAHTHTESEVTSDISAIESSKDISSDHHVFPLEAAKGNISTCKAPPELHTADASPSKLLDPSNPNEFPKAPTLQLPQPQPHPLPQPKTCLTCLDPIPPEKSYTLTCGHVWCQTCVRLKFRSSVIDLSLWPPKCCPITPFSMHVARRILGTSMINELNERAEELKDKKRVYCCAPGCGAYISRSNRDLIGDVAKCGKCGGEMCLLCLSVRHEGRGCRDDEETEKFLEVVEREGYRKCMGCVTVCELMEGCNHITCDNCGYRFCYVCGIKDWKCRCPVFSDRDIDRRINEAMAIGEPGVALLIEQQRGQTNHGGGAEVDVPRRPMGGNQWPMWMM